MTEVLNPAFLQLGGSAVDSELREVIIDSIVNHPRSLQKAIGPSEIGSTCGRQLAYKLLGFPERPQAPNWLATIGTAVHAWLEGRFDLDNLKRARVMDGQERWYIEERVTVGFVPGIGFVSGSCDLYDRVTGTVIDWKVVGPTTLKKYKAQGPSVRYRAQANLYGQGWVNAGLPVATVMIVFLPRNAALDQAHIWSEPFDPSIAAATLDRLGQVQAAVTEYGRAALRILNTADEYCGGCPFLKVGSGDPADGCPGHPQSHAIQDSQNQLTGLLA